ncbi:MAG: hypothetical protein R3324_07545 [Halobacteriales archaeon]|nr:hypothetical protein [Halobacteriales archaeon]
MAATSDGGSIDLLSLYSPHLWWAALVFFGVGDVVTTAVGLTTGIAAEVGPLVAPVIDAHGILALVALKTAAFAASYQLWRLVPAPHNLGVPLGLAALGVLVTAWNLLVLSVGAAYTLQVL